MRSAYLPRRSHAARPRSGSGTPLVRDAQSVAAGAPAARLGAIVWRVNAEVTYVAVPLLISLIGVSAYEIQTGAIRDVVTLPGMIYMLTVRALVGPEPWWNYLLAGVATIAIFSLLLVSVPQLMKRGEWIGFGAVKLLAMVAFAVGFPAAGWVAVAFLVLVALWMVVAHAVQIQFLPSSPILGLAVVVLFASRHILHAA
jgi:prepilin signal peptidase PulO-like enzyme (type II secretory pathway)